MLKSTSNVVFNKSLRVKHLDRSSKTDEAHVYDYLKNYVAKDVCDRIDDLSSLKKRLVLSIGSCSNLITQNINPTKVESLIQADISRGSLERCKQLNTAVEPKFPTQYVQCDEEFLPIKPESIDLAVSCLNFHWVNDLVKSFRLIHGSLKRDSVFIGSLFGGDTLYELRSSLQMAELERLSGFSTHVAPKTTGQDVSTILQRTGFKLITVDLSEVKIRYPSMFELMFDLQGMGENNASVLGSQHMHRDVLQTSAAIYQSLYGNGNVGEGVPATFQIIHFIGWKDPEKATKLKSA